MVVLITGGFGNVAGLPFHHDLMAKLEQGVVEWYNTDKDPDMPKISKDHVRQYINRYA